MTLDKIRADIPYLENKIFLNSAGASLMPHQVVEKINAYLQREEELGGYFAADKSQVEIQEFYEETARLLHCQPRNIAFTHDATDAYVKALSSIPLQSGDVIITSNDDYSSNQIQFISLKKRLGIQIHHIKNLENGDLDIDNFIELIEKHDPKLVAITHIPTNSGLIQDVEAVGKICREKSVPFLVDACQSVGQLNVNVQDIQCDFLSATGRKFLRGPRGTGFLYVSDRILETDYAPLLLDAKGAKWNRQDNYVLSETAIRFQTWEAPYALIIGLTEAMKYLQSFGIDKIEEYNHKLIGKFRANLSSISGVQTYDRGSRTCNIVTFRKKDKSLEQIKEVFDSNRLFFSVSEIEWGLIDFSKKGVDWVIRLSPHYFNSVDDIDRASQIIEDL